MKRLFFCCCCFFLLQASAGAQFIVMKVDGIGGESARFRDKTELLGFILEGSSLQTTSAGGGLAAGKRSYQPVTVLKQSGASSPLLFQLFFTGRHIKEIIIENHRLDPKSGKQILVSVNTFKNVIVTGFKQSTGTAKNDAFTMAANNIQYDEIIFSFQEIIMEYKTGNVLVQDNLGR